MTKPTSPLLTVAELQAVLIALVELNWVAEFEQDQDVPEIAMLEDRLGVTAVRTVLGQFEDGTGGYVRTLLVPKT